MLENTHEWRTELAQFTGPPVPAASLAEGASCNNLGDGPAGEDPAPAADQPPADDLWARHPGGWENGRDDAGSRESGLQPAAHLGAAPMEVRLSPEALAFLACMLAKAPE